MGSATEAVADADAEDLMTFAEAAEAADLATDDTASLAASCAAEAEAEGDLGVDWSDPRTPSHAWRVGARRVRFRWQGHRLDWVAES